MATAEMLELTTAEQFGQRPDPGYPEELVRGKIVAMSVPDRRHGYVCGKADRLFGKEKVTEYLNAGVLVVVVLDPEPQIAHVFSSDDPSRILGVEEELVLPGVLEGFGVRVGRFFEWRPLGESCHG